MLIYNLISFKIICSSKRYRKLFHYDVEGDLILSARPMLVLKCHADGIISRNLPSLDFRIPRRLVVASRIFCSCKSQVIFYRCCSLIELVNIIRMNEGDVLLCFAETGLAASLPVAAELSARLSLIDHSTTNQECSVKHTLHFLRETVQIYKELKISS